MSILMVDGARIDFAAMTLTLGDETYSLRRSNEGKWERYATSEQAINAAVARRRDRFLREEDPVASLQKAKQLMLDAGNGDLAARIPTKRVSEVMRSLPPWSAGRKSTREFLERYLRGGGGLTEAEVDEVLKLEDRSEVLQAIQDWLGDNDGFESLPMFDAPVETAYQRYIHQG